MSKFTLRGNIFYELGSPPTLKKNKFVYRESVYPLSCCSKFSETHGIILCVGAGGNFMVERWWCIKSFWDWSDEWWDTIVGFDTTLRGASPFLLKISSLSQRRERAFLCYYLMQFFKKQCFELNCVILCLGLRAAIIPICWLVYLWRQIIWVYFAQPRCIFRFVWRVVKTSGSVYH